MELSHKFREFLNLEKLALHKVILIEMFFCLIEHFDRTIGLLLLIVGSSSNI